jgi:lysophospholipase L1-like esterase
MLRNVLLALLSVFFCFVIAELGWRLVDPFPYHSPEEINLSLHGNLSMYDSLLGWKGVPNLESEVVTYNSRFSVTHNAQGFRDIPLKEREPSRRTIVFLGDSFTWGYEVNADEMFVHRVRDQLPDFEIFNLAHNGYGTDQSLLTFRNWKRPGDLEWVVLMFSENDIDDNNSFIRYDKPKPKFDLLHFNLVLTGVPVPRLDAWTDPARLANPEMQSHSLIRRIAFRSHFVHDLHYRWRSLTERRDYEAQLARDDPGPDLRLTAAILQDLDREVRRAGGRLLVVFIPSKAEIDELAHLKPYQAVIGELCESYGIEHIDLAPYFHATWLRTYHRLDMHWNARGHRVAADALLDYLRGAG